MLAASSPSLYAILNLPHAGGLGPRATVAALAAGGARVVQLRAKSGFTGELARADSPAWREILRVAATRRCAIVVNDDLELAVGVARVALAMRGGPTVGVHLGQSDLAAAGRDMAGRCREHGLRWGLSTHSLDQVEAAVELRQAGGGPDYLGFGPVFETRSKAKAEPHVGLDELAAACKASDLPVVAIGGIDLEQAAACIQAGAAGLACIAALVGTSKLEVQNAARRFVETIAQANAVRA